MSTINLEDFTSDPDSGSKKEVIVTYRDGSSNRGEIVRSGVEGFYSHFLRLLCYNQAYSSKGELVSSGKSKKDIVGIKFVEDFPSVDYKELSNKLYQALLITEKKAGICYGKAEEAKREYESLQPKMTKYGCGTCSGETVVYGDKVYVLFYGNWYLLHYGKIYPVVNDSLVTKTR